MNRGTLSKLSAALSAGLLALVWGATVAPRVVVGGGPIALIVVAVVALACAGATLVMLRGARPEPSVQRLGAARGLAVWAAPTLSTALLLISWARFGGYPFWVMNGDMAWNTVQSLFVHADGGVAPETHPNPAPLTNVLFAIAYGPGAEPSLNTIFCAHAVVILCIAMVASVLSGGYVAERAAHLHPVLSGGAVCAVGLLPYAGVTLGSVAQLGHANMLTSYLALWLAWIVYSETRWHPAVRISLLLVLSTVIVASWAPLVTVPASLMLVAAVSWWRERRHHGNPSRLGWAALVAALAQFVTYGLAVTLPDMRREGEALSQDGGAYSISMKLTAVIFVAMAVAATLTWATVARGRAAATEAEGAGSANREHERYESARAVSIGVVATLFASVAALGYLMLQRSGMDSLWGYYPVKYVLLFATVTVGVQLGSIVAALRASTRPLRQALALGPAALLVLLPVLAPFGWVPSARALAPAVKLAIQPTSLTDRPVEVGSVETLVDIADAHRGEANLFIDDDWSSEALINFTLIQLSADRSTDGSRSYAFAAEQLSSEQLCDLVDVWDRPVNVFVGDDQAGRAQAVEACSDGRVTVAPVASVR